MDFIDFVNPLIVTVFQPKIFPYFSGGLAGLSILAIIIYIVQSARQAKFTEDEKSGLTKYWQDQLKNYRNVNTESSKLAESLKTQLDNQASQLQSLKLEFNNKDDILRKEVLAKEKLWEELKNAESRLTAFKNKLEAGEKELLRLVKIQDEQKSLQEVHNGLKEQYADLERQVDALNQSLALEKLSTVRLKEEHSKCAKSTLP